MISWSRKANTLAIACALAMVLVRSGTQIDAGRHVVRLESSTKEVNH
jgi:hypothetical protein